MKNVIKDRVCGMDCAASLAKFAQKLSNMNSRLLATGATGELASFVQQVHCWHQ